MADNMTSMLLSCYVLDTNTYPLSFNITSVPLVNICTSVTANKHDILSIANEEE